MIQPYVVAGAHRVLAHQARVGRLHRIDRVLGVARQVVANVAERVEVEEREVRGPPEECRHARREAEIRRIEHPFVLAHVRFAELLPASADIPQR